jgi:hypothetical protein
LRSYANVPIVARVVDGQTLLDLRTVDPIDDDVLGDAVAQSLAIEPAMPSRSDSRNTAGLNELAHNSGKMQSVVEEQGTDDGGE